jgi:hypothetical protein
MDSPDEEILWFSSAAPGIWWNNVEYYKLNKKQI